MSGLDVLRQLRQDGNQVPVLILTARDGIDDRVAGLDAGADDYVTKPFELPELARACAAGRRRAGQAQPLIEVGPLSFDTVGREVRANGQRLALSVRELSVLEMLMARVGRVVTSGRSSIRCPPGMPISAKMPSRSMCTACAKRLEGTGASIQTVRGFGYMLDVEAA